MTHPIESPPVELTAEEAQERAEVMYSLNQRITTGLSAGRVAMWDVAEACFELNEENGWTALHYDTLAEYLADPEVSMTKTVFYRLVSAYRETVVRRQIPKSTVQGIDYSKVEIVMGKVRTGEVDVEEALSDAKEMGWRDLREEYWGPREQTPSQAPGQDDDGDDGGGDPDPSKPEPPDPDDDDDLPVEDVTGVVEFDDADETQPAHISLEQVAAARSLAHWVAQMLAALDVGKVSPALRDEGRAALVRAQLAGLTDV